MKYIPQLLQIVCLALPLNGCQMIVAKTILPLDNTRPAQHEVRIERDLAMILPIIPRTSVENTR